ncbi:MAG: hypothetical protein PHE21_00530 [Candidatus Dojkabacteria bacterium]|nr:hypothetical protein [Candidatus Dojkabacteria bacterium]
MLTDLKETKSITTLEKINRTNRHLLKQEKYLSFPKPDLNNSPIIIYRYEGSNSREENCSVSCLFLNERKRRLLHGDNISNGEIKVTTNIYESPDYRFISFKEKTGGKKNCQSYTLKPDILLIEGYGGPLLFETLSNLENTSKFYEDCNTSTFILTDEGYKPVLSFRGNEDCDFVTVNTIQNQEYVVNEFGIRKVEQSTPFELPPY